MSSSGVFLATNRRRELKTIETGDPLHPQLRVWTFGNDVEPGSGHHRLQVIGWQDAAGFQFPRWVEYSQEAAFFPALEALADRPVKSVTLFIHGFNNDFKHAVSGLTDLQNDLLACGYSGLLAGFDWPSFGGIHLYPKDREHAEASVDQVFDFLGRLRAWCDEKRLPLLVITHSMGNYLFSLVAKKWLWHSGEGLNPWVDYLAMAAPDVASTLFDPPSAGRAADPCGRGLVEMCRKIDILYSGKDKVLSLCEHIEQPYEQRLGRVGPHQSLPPTVTAVDMGAEGVDSHWGYFEGAPFGELVRRLIAAEQSVSFQAAAVLPKPPRRVGAKVQRGKTAKTKKH